MSLMAVIEKNKENFLHFNRAKEAQFQKLITSSAVRSVINSLPFLLCVNERRIPGFVEGDVPLGIKNYIPEDEVLKFIQARFHRTDLEYKQEHPFIQMMALMGSVGTIAYNKKSDFDYWLCVDKRSVSPALWQNFERKVNDIVGWAVREIETEVHFFLNDIESIKHNQFAEDEEESFGSTIGALLKDEFYRSSVIVAGKIPFWWVLPRPLRDREYEELISQVPPEIMESDYVDLGNLYEISKEDFLGAALFQIIKSLGNPFKSIIKIGLLEKYLFGSGELPLLSQKIKLNIQQGKIDNTIIDSYILMFEEVHSYYEKVLDDRRLLDILKQNLYLKTDPQLSRYSGMKNASKLPYNVLVMFRYAKAWGWTMKDIKDLDDFANWDYNRIMIFWNAVKRFMLLSYQKISTQLPALHFEKTISETDFKLLSRKIKTHFSVHENKIDQYITFKDTPFETFLYIEPLNVGIKEVEWRLYKRAAGDDASQTATVKAEKSLVKLLAWIGINQIYNPTFSRIKIQSGYTRVNQNLITELLARIYQLFSENRIPIRNEYYLKPAFPLVSMLLVNFNQENAETVSTIHHIVKTSWGEAFIFEYDSEANLVPILHNILKVGIIFKRNFDDFCEIISPEPFKKHYKEIERLFRNSYEFIVGGETRGYRRFVARVGDQYYTIAREHNALRISSYENIFKLLITISLLPRAHITHCFTGSDPRLVVLDAICKVVKKNRLSVIIEEYGDRVIFFTLNERGNLFTFIKPKAQREETLITLYHFCEQVMKQTNMRRDEAGDVIPVYGLHIDKFGKMSFTNDSKTARALYLSKFKTQSALTVSIEKRKGKEPLYRFSFPDNTESEPSPYSRIVEVVQGKKHLGRRSLATVSAITMTGLADEDPGMGTSPYFLNKYRLEIMLDKALR